MASERRDTGASAASSRGPAATCAEALAQLEVALSASDPSGTAAIALRLARGALERLRNQTQHADQGFQSVLDAMPEAVTVHDRAGRIVFANHAAARLFGYSLDHLLRLSVYDLNPSLPAHHMEEAWRTLQGGNNLSVETTNVRADGSRFPVEVHSNAYIDQGEPRVVAVARDIALRQQIEFALRSSEDRYRQLLNSVDKGIIVSDNEGRIVSANAAASRMLGLSEVELKGDVMRHERWSLVNEQGEPMHWRELPAVRARQGGHVVDSTVVGLYSPRLHGYVWLTISAVPQFLTGQRKPFQVITLFSDVTALKRQTELLRETQVLAHVGSFERDFLRDDLFLSDELAQLLELPSARAITWPELLALFGDEHAAQLRRAAEAVQNGGPPFDLELRLVTRRGHARWMRVIGRAQLLRGEPQGITATVQDITPRKLEEARLRKQALTDPLTGLSNRDALLQGVAEDIRRAAGGPGPTLLYIDLDRFKVINDLLGHAAGDGLLVAAAERLRRAAGEEVLVARFGGDEFMLVFAPGCDPQEPAACAQRITQAFDAPFEYAGEDFTVTASVGMAQCPDDGNSVQQLINHADAALYEAKRRGRNQWQRFSPQLARALTDRLMIETQLRRALDNNEFHLVFQPQIELATGRTVGAEALLRWNNRVLGEMTPDVFVPHAEVTGDIVRIGAWVIRDACRQLRAWADAGLGLLRISVNVSYRQFLSENLVEVVSGALQRHALPGSALELELTERVLIEDAPDTLETFQRLKDQGVQLTIDDFGEGYSALNYLRRLPFDGLKISHEFMQGIPGNAADSAICEAMIRMAGALGVVVVAEGVENADQRAFLLKHGAQLAQGFLFSRPLTAEELELYVRDGIARA